MSGDASWALQKALYETLVGDLALQSLLGTPARIFDDVPEETIFPYLTIGEVRSRDWRGVEGGIEHDLRFHAWSRYAGRQEIKKIMSGVYDVLHDGKLNLTGQRLVNLRYVFGDIWRRPDNETYQGVMRYRAMTQPLVA